VEHLSAKTKEVAMRQHNGSTNRPAPRAFTSTGFIVTLTLVLLVSILSSEARTVAGEQRSDSTRVDYLPEVDRAAANDREQIATLLRHLRDDREVDSERVVRFLLGINDGDKIDSGRIAVLLGVEEGDELDFDRILRLMLGLADDDKPLKGEQIVRLLLGIDDDDEIDSDRIDQFLDGIGESVERGADHDPSAGD